MVAVNSVLRYLLLIFFMTCSLLVIAADIDVRTDRNPVSMNESFQLVFSASGSVDDDPDFSPLHKNFQILSTSQSSNYSIINGKIDSTKTWTLMLLPLKEGTLTIPSIAFGSDHSPMSTVTVAKSMGQSGGSNVSNNNEVFIDVEVSENNPYVQSQIIYTLKLFRGVATSNASLDDPKISSGDAIIERIDEDKSYETRIKGKPYLVVERNYAIYPQSSGNITIASVRFQAQISHNTFSMLDPFGPKPKLIIRQSDPITLTVKPIPNGFSGAHWLPAKNVSLKEEWSQNPPEFKVGAPITRTLTLTANGQSASQLPELPNWETQAFKLYPDQPVLDDSKTASGITGSRLEKIAIIPGRTGNYVLPGITIPWWNTTTNKQEYATLPERRIIVAAAGAQTNKNGLNFEPPALSHLALPEPNTELEQQELGVEEISEKPEQAYWKWLSLLFALGWVITAILFWKAAQGKKQKQNNEVIDENIKVIVKELKQACDNNNSILAKEKLLQWGRTNWPNAIPTSLGEIAKRCETELKEEINKLNGSLYGKQTGDWQGVSLWGAFNKEWPKKKSVGNNQQGKLEPLYKI